MSVVSDSTHQGLNKMLKSNLRNISAFRILNLKNEGKSFLRSKIMNKCMRLLNFMKILLLKERFMEIFWGRTRECSSLL